MSEFDLLDKTLLGLGGGGVAVMTLFKAMSFIKKEQAGQAGDDAIAKQFKALTEQITQCQADNTALRADCNAIRADYNRLDTKFHKQQARLTRTEMLLRQFSSLVQEHGTPVPTFMKVELDDLVPPEDRAVTQPGELSRRKDY